MKRTLLILIFIAACAAADLRAQLQFNISADKNSYEYGGIMHLRCSVINPSENPVSIYVMSYGSCQAEFEFDDFKSIMWTVCHPTAEKIILPAHSSRNYNWTIDPLRFGLPENDGQHKIAASFNYYLWPDTTFRNKIELRDTIFIEAPKFFGGQIDVSFEQQNDSAVSELKDSLRAETLNRNEFPWGITEIWQIQNIPVKTLVDALQNDKRLKAATYNRYIQYDSISVITSAEEYQALPEEFRLYNNYPNPCLTGRQAFNPSTTIRFSIPSLTSPSAETLRVYHSSGTTSLRHVSLVVYDVLGRVVSTLVDEQKQPGIYSVDFNAAGLPSGIYFYRLSSGAYSVTKKMLLLK